MKKLAFISPNKSHIEYLYGTRLRRCVENLACHSKVQTKKTVVNGKILKSTHYSFKIFIPDHFQLFTKQIFCDLITYIGRNLQKSLVIGSGGASKMDDESTCL